MNTKSGILIIRSNGNEIQGFDVYSLGDTQRTLTQKTGLTLIKEKERDNI